ncbi:MAG: hypothetical protein HUU22_16800 [Phycisphaerae bacterium]|nr:hypothetical protein [Phycisphaerae bacterium]NUQ47680.1 hypothetical protein [Phycisphaerae bacterium]
MNRSPMLTPTAAAYHGAAAVALRDGRSVAGGVALIGYLLFEALWLCAALAVFGFVVLLIVGRRMERQRRGRLWLIWMLAVAGLFFLQKAVVTEREELRGVFDSLVKAVERKQIDVLAGLLATDYQDSEFDRDELTRWLRAQLADVDISNSRIHRCDVKITGERAEMELAATALVSYQGAPVAYPRGEWTLHWRRTAEGWRVVRIQPRKFEDRAVKALSELRR